ncbi:carotenoid oxygenase family protein [Halocatena halophila]|uniref:carotenoid oxygenase family protein n=1 Tax=Halocatena halophila TaxID=2814576 RepID=UPI002ED56138
MGTENRIAPRESSHAIGFRSVTPEQLERTLTVEGTIPSWLTGTYVVNGPAKFETRERSLSHWFDGFGMLHRFRFDGDRVHYRRRFVESGAYTHARDTETLGYREFATDPSESCFDRAVSLLAPPSVTDNANGPLARYGDRYVVTSESPGAIEFDPETLSTVGQITFEDDLVGQVSCAHPQYDPIADETITFLTRIARQSSYTVVRIADGKREPIASIAVDRPCYMHSFALTPTYVVLVEFPYAMNPFTFRLSDRPFIEQFDWRPERGTRLLVFDRSSGRLLAKPRMDAFFALHHVNAFERPGELLLDLLTYPTPKIVEAFSLDSIRNDRMSIPSGRLRRVRLTIDDWLVSSRTLVASPLEWPQIVGHRRTHPYQFVYGVGKSDPSSFYDRLLKLETTGRTTCWHEPATYPGEPTVVPAPTPASEDDGVVLSLVLDGTDERSFVLVLDGETFTELARVPLDHPIPYPRHGQYYSTDEC